jgi:hypothetical protein
MKTFNYLPYKYTIFFLKPLMFSKRDIQLNNSTSKKLHKLINATEKKSMFDPNYWETKMLYQINNQNNKIEFERSYINLVTLSKNNKKRTKVLKVYYLRNVPRFSKEVKDFMNFKD